MMDISSMLEVQVNEVKEVDSKENVTPRELLPSITNAPVPISQEEYTFYKLRFGNDVSVVRFQRLHCTACDAHIGSAPVDAQNMFEHPVLRTLLCAKCRDFYGDGTFEQGDDATDMFCRWCANGGNLYCCSFCSNTFCYKCIRRNFDAMLRKKIEADERWKCFVCDPTDLYNARATCWALLLHIQTMNRLFQNCNKLSQDEIDEKMNKDESKCCPRKKKRKRRNNGSNSEEEDQTFAPTQVTQNVISKRRKRNRAKAKISIDSNKSVIDKHSGMSEDNNSVDHNEILPSLFSCEQTMVECENATVRGDGTIISQSQVNSVHHRVNPLIAQQPMMYNAPVMNVVGNPNFLQPPHPTVSLRHVSSSSLNQTSQINQMRLYQALHSAPAPMVTIPNQNVNILNQSRFSLSESQTPSIIMSPSIIEIESDPEDVTVISSSQISSSVKNSGNINKAVPVALVSSKNNYDSLRKQEMKEKHNTKTLNQRLLPHGKEIDNILGNLKMKFQGLFEATKREELKKYEISDARLLIKQFHREIYGTVTQLACINDRIVREYNKWKRHQTKEVTQSVDKNDNKKCKLKEVPLDMICINESDSDEDINSEVEYNVINPSELVGTTNVMDGVGFFKKRNTVDRAVGDHLILSVDKSVQVNDMKLQDYDKCIRNSELKKVNQQVEKKNNSVLSVKQGHIQPKTYEEQFIHFLQNQCIIPRSIQVENFKELPDPNETSLKDLIEANSPFISEMLENMDNSVASTSSISVKKESDLKSFELQLRNSITCKAASDLLKKINNINTNESIHNDLQEEVETQKRHFYTSNESYVVNVSKIEDQDLSTTMTNAIDSESSNEDDCTIIDD